MLPNVSHLDPMKTGSSQESPLFGRGDVTNVSIGRTI